MNGLNNSISSFSTCTASFNYLFHAIYHTIISERIAVSSPWRSQYLFRETKIQAWLTLTVYDLLYYAIMEPDEANSSGFIGIFFYFTGGYK